MKCGILDYGTGTIQSVQNALESLGHTTHRDHSMASLEECDVIVFPGQGAFGPAMSTLTKLNIVNPLRSYILSNRPFIGICLGFQLLFNGSDESPNTDGLGCLSGNFRRFSSPQLAVPHMGWNSIQTTQTTGILSSFNQQLFYFVHSYFLPNSNYTDAATTTYGVSFVSAMATPTQLLTQFHPEKSGDTGLELLRSFLKSL
jgi:glutamine amidotransferase/cyclase